MSNGVEFTKKTDTNWSNHVGDSSLIDHVVARGTCPFCGHRTGFRQSSLHTYSNIHGRMVAVTCEVCECVLSCSIAEGQIYPGALPPGIEDLPDQINKYYQEARRCLQANAPNGSVTLFRKVIHTIAIHYEIAEIDESKSIYDMINDLHDKGEINEKLRKSLLAAKDIGNDGAHVNENEPDMDQAMAIKGLIDSVLDSTVVQDQRLDFARDKHPNKFEDE